MYVYYTLYILTVFKARPALFGWFEVVRPSDNVLFSQRSRSTHSYMRASIYNIHVNRVRRSYVTRGELQPKRRGAWPLQRRRKRYIFMIRFCFTFLPGCKSPLFVGTYILFSTFWIFVLNICNHSSE